MFLKMGKVTLNTNSIDFAEPINNGKDYKIHFIGGEELVVPAEKTGGYFSQCPTVEDFLKIQQQELSRARSQIVGI